MISKTVKYVDYNGTERTETHWFNLTEAELMEMELSTTGGLAEMMQNLIEAQDMPSIFRIFKDLVLKAYGQRAADGRRFIKTENGRKLADEFAETEAYSIIFTELATNADEAAKFINGVVPQQLADKAKANPIPPAVK